MTLCSHSVAEQWNIARAARQNYEALRPNECAITGRVQYTTLSSLVL